MNQRTLLELQTSRGAKTISTDANTKSIDTVINECRKEIREQSSRYRDLNPVEKTETIKKIIMDYVMERKPLVHGYIDGENRPDTLKLADKLVEDITDYGILTTALMDETVFEIRCNGKELKVEKGNRVVDLTDKEGNILSFESTEQQEIVIRKILGDIRLTPKDALVNSRTVEGYRVAAVHSTAMSPDPNDPAAERYHAFVLRKFKKSKMNLGDIVLKETMSDNMARFCALCTAGGLSFATVGPTASGKSTTNNAILQSVPSTTRTVLIQNPSEIDLRFKDASGRVYNDVLHLEAIEKENPSPKDPTMANIMDHVLRLSPTFIVLGEIRSNREFELAVKIGLAGHAFSTTYHAENSDGAISRFLSAYMAESGNIPAHLALKTITDVTSIIIVQKIMRDGTRRVIQITEIIGPDPDNENRVLLNDLFRFEIDAEPEYDEAGRVVKIFGHHKRVGKISKKLERKLQLEGVAARRYDFLTKEPFETEVETYTGKNIDTYGILVKNK